MIDWNQWFQEYLTMFCACARGDCESHALLEYYGVPLLLTGDEGFVALKSVDDVIRLMRGQVDGLRAAEYRDTDVWDTSVSVLNASSVLYRGRLSHRRADGGDLGQVTMTFLLTNGSTGVRISMMAVHADSSHHANTGMSVDQKAVTPEDDDPVVDHGE